MVITTLFLVSIPTASFFRAQNVQQNEINKIAHDLCEKLSEID